MCAQKGNGARGDLKSFKEEIIHEFHIISEGVISQVKQVAEGVSNVNEKLDRFREEIRGDVDDKFTTLAQAIGSINDKVDTTRQELKGEIQGVRQELKEEIQGVRRDFGDKLDQTRQELKTEDQETRREILAAIKFSYAELDRRLTTLEREFLDLKLRVEKMERRSIS